MSNLHRIQWIDVMIRAGRHLNCSTIAAHFEISRRQATRDIEYLRDSMGAPVAFDPAENGYYYTDTTFVLPAQVISTEEQRALAYLAHQYRQSGGALGEQLALLFARLAGEEGGAAVSQQYITREEFQEFAQGMKDLLRRFLDFFLSYGLELGQEPKDNTFGELVQKLQTLSASTNKSKPAK